MPTVTGEAHGALGMAALLLAGGVAAYVRRGSAASLAASAAFAGAYAAGAYLVSSGKPGEGHALAGAAGGTLAVVMGARAARSGKLVPALVAGASGVSAAYELSKAREWLS